jgi:hypothetical protein
LPNADEKIVLKPGVLVLKRLYIGLVKIAGTAIWIIALASFGWKYVTPVLATTSTIQTNSGQIVDTGKPSPYIVVAQVKSNKKSFKRRHKKKQRTRRQSSRHNFYDAQVNDYRGRRYKGPGRDLRSEWCLDCFRGGGWM